MNSLTINFRLAEGVDPAAITNSPHAGFTESVVSSSSGVDRGGLLAVVRKSNALCCCKYY